MLVYPRLQKHLLCSDLDLAKVCVWGSARLGGGGGGENPVWLAPSLKLLNPSPHSLGPLCISTQVVVNFMGRCLDQGTGGLLMTGLPLREVIDVLQTIFILFHVMLFYAAQNTH